ncbi:hypothetical protein V6L77_21065 [Pannonibacter sp. Pt2-lr]
MLPRQRAERLTERQRQIWDPLLAAAEAELAGRFRLSGGIMHVAQDESLVAAFRKALDGFRRWNWPPCTR